MSIPLAKPDIQDTDREAVQKVLETSVLSLGPQLRAFEKRFSDFVGVPYAVAVNSGTSALHLVIRALGIDEGDEVITTPFSFISSANCILYERATPVFADIDPKTLTLDPDQVEAVITERTKAIVAVDVFGHPAHWNRLEEIAKKHSLHLIEDSAEALGSAYHGRKCGSFGTAAIFGFYPNKQLTMGEGGVVVTHSREIAELCRSMANQGRRIHEGAWLEHERLGFNYRLSEISCALGSSQLARIQDTLARRKKAADLYTKKLSQLPELILPFTAPKADMSHFVYVVQLKANYTREDRDAIIVKLKEREIGAASYFVPIHLQPFYQKRFGFTEGNFPTTEHVSHRTLALPFYTALRSEEIDEVTASLGEIIRSL